MLKDKGFCKCDYCGDEFGEFDNATGNHTSCIEIAQLRQALTEANERIEYANAGDLVTIPRELVLAMEAKMKEQAAKIERLTAQCKHALDDEWEMCECGQPLDKHEKSDLHPCKESGCAMFWLAEAK